jgi:tetratricopeptide (TPR) repeat protein
MDSTATLSFYQHVLAGKILTDGHDIFVEVAVTTGILGLGCFLVWFLGAARLAARCSFLGFAAAMVAVELVEPLNVAILPLAFLALGAATAVRLRPAEIPDKVARQLADQPTVPTHDPGTNDRAGAPYARVASIIAAGLALFLGVTMVTGDAYMLRGTNSGPGRPYNLAAAKDANRLLPYWPDPALELAQIKAFDSLNSVSAAATDLAAARQWTTVAVSRDSKNPALWTLLAGADLEIKEYRLARTDYDRALSRDKWYTQALQGLAQLAETDHDWSRAIHFYRLALTTAVNDAVMSASLRASLSAAEGHVASGSG